MSKFFAEGNISDSDDSDDSQNNAVQQKKKVNYEYEQEYHAHGLKRKILTEKEKKKTLFKKMSQTVMTAVNNKDWDKVWDNMQEMLKEIQKSTQYIQKEGTPTSFLRTLNQVNDEVNAITPEEKKKMKNPKSFNIMKQKLKNKIIPDYSTQLKNLPQQDQSESSSVTTQENKNQSEESESEIYREYLKSDDPMIRRKYWLKRDKVKKVKQESSSDSEKEVNQNISKKPKFHLPEQKKKEELIIADSKQAENKIKKIVSDFTKISTQQKREEYLSTLDAIIAKSKQYKDFERLSILLSDIPIRFEVTRQMKHSFSAHFPRQNWLILFKHICQAFKILQESQDEDLIKKIVYFEQSSEQNVAKATQKSVYELLRSFIINMERQLIKSFDYLENSELQYSERLQDLIKFIDFMYRVSNQLSMKEELEKCSAEIAFKVLENCYFMSSDFMSKIKEFSKDVTFTELEDEQKLQIYTQPIFSLKDQQITVKTILYLTFNHALNRRKKAKQLLANSNVHEIINTFDSYTQGCFNRAIVQLGISSFYRGHLDEARQILDGICGFGKNRQQNKEYIRSFLAQKIYHEGEVIRTKTLPYYLHLNIDVIEAVQLMSSMILQVPYTLSEGGRISSKTFKRLFYEYERSHFIAQPLNFRDLVYAASNQLKLGNWKECFDKLLQINIWNQIGNPQPAQTNLEYNVKQSALKCYLIANRKCFNCVSLLGLAEKFDLPLKTIRKLLCKWINQKQREFNATITDDDYLNIIEKTSDRESDLQRICEKLFVKLEDINSNNDQIAKQKPIKQEEEDEGDEEANENKFQRRINIAITDKLKTILSRRAA